MNFALFHHRKFFLLLIAVSGFLMDSIGQGFTFYDPATGLPDSEYFIDTLCQGQSRDHCLFLESAGNDHNITGVSGSDGTFVIAPPSSPYDTCFRYTASFSYEGFDTLSITVTNNLNQTGVVNVIFLVVDPDNPTNAGPNQQICTVSNTTISAVSPDPFAIGYWTVIGGTGILASPTSPTTAVTNLSFGVNSFLWHQDYPCDANIDLIQVFRYTGTPPTANAGPDATLCSGTTYTMQANSPGVSATGTWEITCGNATIFNINAANALVANLGLGINCFEWNIDNGPCPGGESEDQMIIYVYNQNHPPANAGPDQSLCSGTFTFATLSGSTPQVPATGLWTVVNGSGAITNPTQPTTTVSGLSIGLNTFQWTITNGPCGTYTDQISIFVYSQSSPAANAGTDQQLCLPTNSTTLAANTPISPATGSWSVIQGTGSFALASNPNTSVSGLSQGVNIFRWTVNNGPCSNPITTDDVTITVFPATQPSANAGPDQQLCFTGGPLSATLAANAATAPGTGTWSVITGSGTFANSANPTTSVSGLSIGTNTFQWTINNGPCGSPTSDQVTITVFNGTAMTANAGPDGQLCTPLTNYVMQATAPVFPATGVWTQTTGTGVIVNPTSPTTAVTNLGVGVNTFQWTINNGPCGGTVFDTMIITVYSNGQSQANAGADQEYCFVGASPVTATMLANSAISPAIGTWSIILGSATITSPNSPTTTITGLLPGTYIFQWSINNGPCGTTSDLITVLVYNPSQPEANAGTNQSICSTTSTVNLSASPLFNPATGLWTVVSGSGVFANALSANTTVSGLSLGDNVFQWTVDNGPCTAPAILSDQVTITVFNSSQQPAAAGPDQSICNTTSVVNLNGNVPLFPATGQWVVIAGSGSFSNATSPVSTVTGLSVGQNIYQWSINNGPCGSITTDQMSVFVYDVNAPAATAGADQFLCLPSTSTILGGNSPVFPAVGTWQLISGSGTIVSPSLFNSSVTNLGIGENIFQWTINNGTCGTITSNLVSIFLFNNTQEAANAGPNASMCTPQSTYVMQANDIIFPAIGEWTLISGTGTISDVNDPEATITGLGVGSNIFRWTILNGPCPGGSNFDEMTIFVFDENQLPATAGPDQEFCFNGVSPVNTVMSGSAVIAPGSGLWTLIQGSGNIISPTSSTTSITNLGVGENIFQWTVSNGPCNPPSSSDQVSIFVYSSAQQQANAGPNQDLCSTNPATTLAGNAIIFPASGVWTVIQGGGILLNNTSPTSTVSGLSLGVNILQWTVDNGPCGPITNDQVVITVYNVNQFPANAGADFSICSDQTSITLTGNAVSAPATSLWSLVSGSGTVLNPTGNVTTVTGLGLGTNTFQYTILNGACATQTSDQIIVTVYNDAQPSASAGSDQNLCLPQTSTTLAANAVVAPATGIWTLVQGSGVITSPSNPNSGVTGLGVGTNVFQWTINNGPCAPSQTSDQVVVTVYSNLQTVANAGTDQEFCEPVSSATLSANPIISPATGSWILVQGTGTIVSPSSSTTLVNGLSQGENIFQWTINNGPCSPSITVDQISVFIYESTQSNATAGPDQFICTPQSSVFMNANAAIFPAVGSWTLISGNGNIISPNSPTTQISGLSVGINTFQWTIDNGPCSNGITSDQVSIYVYESGASLADAGVDQFICTPQNSVVLNGNLPVVPAIGSWTLVSGSGIIVTPGNASTTVTGLGIGENIFQWTIDNGNCGFDISSDQVSIFVYSEFALNAEAGPDQDLCSPQSTTTMNASDATFPGYGEWSLVSGTGTVVSPNDPNTAITGLTIGPNVFQWTVYNGPCANAVTSDIVTITIFDGGADAPFAGDDQELCSPVSSTIMNADPAVFPGVGEWTLVSGTGSFVDSSDPNSVVNGLSIGVNVFRWTVNYSTCGTPFDEVTIIVYNSGQGEAVAGVDQSFCTPVSSTNFDADPVLTPGYGTWSLISGSGSIQNSNNPNSLVTNLTVGANTFVWTVYNGNCLNPSLTTDTITVFIFESTQEDADAGDDQELCSPVSTTILDGNSLIFPATGNWQLVQGTGTILNASDPNSAVTGLSIGENIFCWTVNNGPCELPTNDCVSIFVNFAGQESADAGPDQELCSPASSTVFEGNSLTFPALGTWTLVSGTGNIADASDPESSVSGLSIGENIFEWSIYNGSCGPVTTDQVSIFVFNSGNLDADAGDDQEMCLPQNFTSMNGSSLISPAVGTWSLIQGTATIASPNDPNSEIAGIAVGENIFVWTVYNGPCSNGLTTDTVSIFVYDFNAPVADAGEDQLLCEPQSSTTLTATVPGDPGFGTWTIVGISPVLIANINDPNTLITNLPVGETILTWTVYNGPCSVTNTTDQVSIFVYESSQLPANAGEDQQICTPQNFTVMNGNSYVFPATGTWELLQGGATIEDIHDPTTNITGLSVGTNIFSWTINNGPCDPSITSDIVVIEVFNNTQANANAGFDQEFCLPVTSAFLDGSDYNDPSVGTWMLISGSANFEDVNDPETEVTNLGVGQNIFVWTVTNGPCGASTDTTIVSIFDPGASEADAGPDGSFCTPESTYMMQAVNPSSPGVGTWLLVDGNGTIAEVNNPTSVISGLTVGENIFTWTVYNGPCEPATVDSISIFVYDENQEDANAGLDIEICTPADSVSMAANIPIFPATGLWTLISGNAIITDPSDPNSPITSIGIGENIFSWCITNGPCVGSFTCDTMSVFRFDENANVAEAGEDQFYCEPVSSATLNASVPSAPGVGTWTLVGGTGIIASQNDPNTEITGLSVGANCFQWEVYNGPCTNTLTSDVVCIYIYDDEQPPADAGPDQELCTPNDDTQLAANSVIFPATGTWTLIDGSGAINDIHDPNTIVMNMLPGFNVFVWTIDNGPCLNPVTSDTMVVAVFDSTLPLADAGPDQEICFPSVDATLTGSILSGAATGEWTLFNGGGIISSPTTSSTDITGMPVGENIFVWTVYNGPCGTSSDTVSVFVNDPLAPVADAGPDVSYCTPVSTYQMTANAATDPGVGTWIWITGSGIIDAPNDPNSLITALTTGENIFMWSIDNGACGTSVDVMSIFIYNENTPNADAGPAQELCLPLNSTSMDASPAEFPAIGEWTLIEGFGNIVDVNSPQTVITDLQLGTNGFVWTVNNGPCPNGITSDTVYIYVFENDIVLPIAGPDQNICTPQNTVVMSASFPVDPNYGYWTLLGGSAVIEEENNPLSVISGLAVGVNTLSWTFYNGPCENTAPADTLIINVFDEGQPPAECGANQELCMPQSSTILEANDPIVPAVGTWTVLSGGGLILEVNNPNSPVVDLDIGTNLFVWTIDNGPCDNAITSDTIAIFLYDQNPQVANAGPDLELCTPDECAILQAIQPNDPSEGTWTIISAIDENGAIPFGTIDDVNDPSAEICALGVGIHTLDWTLYNGPCNPESSDQMTISVYDATALPADAGSDQELCSPQNSTSMQGSVPVFPAIGTWNIISGSGNVEEVNNPTSDLTGLTIGTTVLTWSIYNGPCGTTIDTVIVFVFDPLTPVADAGPDQDFCDPPTGLQLAGSNIVSPAIGTWTQIAGDITVTFSDPNDPNATTSAPALNESAFVWTVYNGICNEVTTDTMWVYVNDSSVANADAGADQSYCGIPASIQLQGSVTIGNTAVGTWTVIQGGGTFSDIHNEVSVVADLTIGTHIYQWEVDNGACGISQDTVVIFIYDPQLSIADAGDDISICEHEFVPFNLNGSPLVNPATGEWNIVEGPAELQDTLSSEPLLTSAGEIITLLEDVQSILTWSVYNGPCGSSIDTLVIVLEDCLTVEVPDAFSPNGDGVNDMFEIPNIETYPGNKLQVFNRWGALIFEASPYHNEWDGTSNHAATIGEPLPVSTYYYILELGTGDKTYNGFVYLKR